jgi:hypothetical protein
MGRELRERLGEASRVLVLTGEILPCLLGFSVGSSDNFEFRISNFEMSPPPLGI